ncbi:MAG: hypothetical protein ACRDF4_09200 [Rhabdochlamydiaceae bacterium]
MPTKHASKHRLPVPNGEHRKTGHKVAKHTEAERPLAWIDDLIASVPPEAWDNFPTEGSVNHDHYLYGAPKRKE